MHNTVFFSAHQIFGRKFCRVAIIKKINSVGLLYTSIRNFKLNFRDHGRKSKEPRKVYNCRCIVAPTVYLLELLRLLSQKLAVNFFVTLL